MSAAFGILTAYWGTDRLTVPTEALSGIDLPDESFEFLTAVGIPTREGLPLPLFKSSAKFALWQHSASTCLVIAEEYGEKLCIESGDGAVVAMDAHGELGGHFVNASAQQLAAFLMIYAQSLPALRDATGDETPELVAELRHQFTKLDAVAMSNDENWWPVVLEQIEEGLM